ncbi:putative lipid-transfer protein DIR1 [Arachis ipaensis]|uniref:putative lipid-transfer protein DIR1 n=2 Tax=Arachis TaxID=3817 RepID=UPI0007AF9658|nr:putative lipid-transfer protein DIR1 [Arachis ipaensis]XP_025672850.1 putative lipid-transfer protein DIR1 [Arachis hypogaea]
MTKNNSINTISEWFLFRWRINYIRRQNNSKMKLFSYRAFSLVWFLVFMVALVVVAQVDSTSCTSTFFSALVQLIPCRAAVAPFSPIPPSESCCNALRALGQPCLCVLVNGPPISGVDRNMASQLPEKCTTNFEPCVII